MRKLFSQVMMLVLLLGVGISTARADDTKLSSYDRIKKTGVIRCGYLIYAPYITQDPNTGKLGGVTVDMMEAIGKELGYKIEWTEEVSMTTAFEAMDTGRYDMACIPFWLTGQRIKVSAPTRPLYYDGGFAVVRQDDNRFDKDTYNRINSDDIKISIQEGNAFRTFIDKDFPKAKVTEQMALTDPLLQLQDVMAKKADVAFAEMSLYKVFEKNNPGVLKLATTDPFVVMPAALWVPVDDFKLKALLDNTIEILQSNGTFASILKSYGGREMFSYVQKPYQPVIMNAK